MCLAQFFGNLSPFQIIVSAIAFTSLYTLYKSSFEGAKISAYLGDAVRISVSPNGNVSTFYLMCNLINKSIKAGTVHRLEVQVSDSRHTTYNFTWNTFFRYLPGGNKVEKESDIYPIAISQKDSKLLLIEFKADTDRGYQWSEGRYEFKLIGWVNSKDRLRSSNLKSLFHIQITKDTIGQLNTPTNSPIFITVPVTEWERQHR